MFYKTTNPLNNKVEKEFPSLKDEEINERIERSYAAFLKLKETTVKERITKLQKLHDIIQREAEKLGKIQALEMGKPVTDSKAEVGATLGAIKYLIEHGEEILKPKEVKTEAKRSMILYQPLGPIYTVKPWNFPLLLSTTAACNALLVGNTVLLKHAPNCPQMALALEEIFAEAGFGNGEFINLFADHDKTELVLSNPHVRGVTFTGSTIGGKAVASLAGKYVKKHVLELGGSDAFIVLEDADIDKAVKWGVGSRMWNGGQCCISAKRMILHKNIANEFIDKVRKQLEDVKMGDPNDESTTLGPLARKDLCDLLKKQVSDSIKAGAELVHGDAKDLEISDKPEEGNFFKPVILKNPPKTTPAYQQELFGPAFTVFEVETDEEAIRLANDSEYGLGGSVHTQNIERGVKIAEAIDTGMMFVNKMTAPDFSVPFGGVKSSGYGREFGSEGLLELTNQKLLWVE